MDLLIGNEKWQQSKQNMEIGKANKAKIQRSKRRNKRNELIYIDSKLMRNSIVIFWTRTKTTGIKPRERT